MKPGWKSLFSPHAWPSAPLALAGFIPLFALENQRYRITDEELSIVLLWSGAAAVALALIARFTARRGRSLAFTVAYAALPKTVGVGMGFAVLVTSNTGGAQALTPLLIMTAAMDALAAAFGWELGAAPPQSQASDIPNPLMSHTASAFMICIGFNAAALFSVVFILRWMDPAPAALILVGLFLGGNMALAYVIEARTHASGFYAAPWVGVSALVAAISLLAAIVEREPAALTAALFPLGPTLACAVGALLGERRRLTRIEGHRCLACGYNLDGLHSPQCPECGHQSPPAAP